MGRKRLPETSPSSPSPLEESVQVSFFVEKSIANQLNKFHNKSALMRKAIMSIWSSICPLCHSTGAVPRGLATHYSDLIANATIYCENECHTLLVLPHTLSEIPPSDHPRVGQFLLGGELFCERCYPDIPTCSECSWKVSVAGMDEHIKMIHRP